MNRGLQKYLLQFMYNLLANRRDEQYATTIFLDVWHKRGMKIPARRILLALRWLRFCRYVTRRTRESSSLPPAVVNQP